MKKSIKKLSLNKSTVSNLNVTEMSQKVGGKPATYSCGIKTFNCRPATYSCGPRTVSL